MNQQNKKYDLVVIGAGPAGYVAAIRAAQLGLKTACIDKWQNTQGEFQAGGTCLNVGCIPSKALLESSEKYQQIKQGMQQQGIVVSKLQLDLEAMIKNKDEVIAQLSGGVKQLLQYNKVDLVSGIARLHSPNQVEVKDDNGNTSLLDTEHIIIATGSSPIDIPVAPIDHQYIVDSSDALAFDKVPNTLGIIGAGVIGLELGSVWSRLGSKVTILEAQETFLPMLDDAISDLAFQSLTGNDFQIKSGARVIKASVKKGRGKSAAKVNVEFEEDGQNQSILVDKLLVAVGRSPNSQNLTVKQLELLLDERGFIDVDDYCRTNIPNVYAIGDVVRGPMLAHKGSEEGICVVENIALNKHPERVNLDRIPSVIYTDPEIAWIGASERELKAQGIDYKVGIFPFRANGRALATNHTEGKVKIISDEVSDEILAAHIIGHNASELIAQMVIAIELQASNEDICRMIFAHPTLSEAIHEACLAAEKRAIHSA